MPVRVKKTRQNKGPEPGSDSIRTDKALGGGVQDRKSALKIGLEVIGVKHGGTVENRGIDKTILRLGVAARRHPCGPAFTSRVSAFLRAGRSIVRKTRAFAATKDVIPRPQRMAKIPSGGGLEPGELTTGHRNRSQPLDPARQSFCDAAQLSSRCMLRGLPRA